VAVTLFVDLAAMANSHNEYYETILLKLADDAIVAYAVPPETG
jgi:hypothetical protein